MNFRNYTLNFFPEDAVGNDAGKHNFNFLSLETKICNLSSSFFNSNYGFVETFNNFLIEAQRIDSFARILANPSANSNSENKSASERFNQMYTTVALLSSYWSQYEFSTVFPVNLSQAQNSFIPINDADAFLGMGQQSSLLAFTKGTNLDSSVYYILKFLDSHHPYQQYPLNSKINVCVPIYSRVYDPNKPEQAQIVSMSNPLTHFTRTIKRVDLTRVDTNITGVKTFKFLRTPSSWSLINIIGPSPLNVLGTSLSGRKILQVDINENVANFDLGEVVSQNPDYKPGQTDIVVTISPGIKVFSITPNAPALVLGNVDDLDTIALFNFGLILGAGGRGGDGGNSSSNVSQGTTPQNGSPGGTAIAVFSESTIIENHGAIYGGGGGGAGGLGGVGGSLVCGGGGGGGAGYDPGEPGFRGTNDKLINRIVAIQDGAFGSNTVGGDGGPGLFGSTQLTEAELDLVAGKKGGGLGEKGEDAYRTDEQTGETTIIAYGGEPGAYVVGNSNVYWSITGERKGRFVI